MQYTEKVMQHFMNPHNVGVIENLNVPWANSAGTPIANKTCDGCKLSDEQAEPELTAIPFKLRFKSIDSPSKYLKVILEVPGNLLAPFPFIFISGILFDTSSSK